MTTDREVTAIAKKQLAQRHMYWPVNRAGFAGGSDP